MQLLEKEFIGGGETRGFTYSQVKSSERAFLYRVSSEEDSWFEIFERKVQQEGDVVRMGVNIHHICKELYPNSKSFGVWAWTTSNPTRAEELFSRIDNRKIKEKL